MPRYLITFTTVVPERITCNDYNLYIDEGGIVFHDFYDDANNLLLRAPHLSVVSIRRIAEKPDEA